MCRVVIRVYAESCSRNLNDRKDTVRIDDAIKKMKGPRSLNFHLAYNLERERVCVSAYVLAFK